MFYKAHSANLMKSINKPCDFIDHSNKTLSTKSSPPQHLEKPSNASLRLLNYLNQPNAFNHTLYLITIKLSLLELNLATLYNMNLSINLIMVLLEVNIEVVVEVESFANYVIN